MGLSRRLIAVVLAFCASVHSRGLVRLEKSEEATGSTFSVALYGSDRARLKPAAVAAFAEIHRLDQMLSNYRPDSEWSAVNRDAAVGPVRVPPELFQLLSDCMDHSRESGGTFDITVRPLMKVWGFYKGEGLLPRHPEVARALQRLGYRHVLLDLAHHTVRFDRAGVELDPGGIGKGYAIDRMVEVLKEHGVEIALVSGSGSSIYEDGCATRGAELLADYDSRSGRSAPRGSGGIADEHVAIDIGQLREVLLGRGSEILSHRGPANGLARVGHGVCFGTRATHHRQRGLGQAILYPWLCLDRRA